MCRDQTVRSKILSHERWKPIEIGDYVIKRSGSDSVEKRASQAEEARDATRVLIERCLHPNRRPLRWGGAREEIRSRAVEGLARIGVPDDWVVSTLPGLIETLSNKDEAVRMNAAKALRRLGSPHAMGALEKWS